MKYAETGRERLYETKAPRTGGAFERFQITQASFAH